MIKIDQAFTQAFIDADFGLEIAHENIPYKPTGQTAYAEIMLLPNPIIGYDLSQTNTTDGIFRVIINYPYDGGAIEAKTKADEIFSAFPISSRVTYEGQSAIVTGYSRQLGVAIEGWYRLVLSINYQSKITR